MAHKTLIGGTAYEISGGKTLVGGTAYSIKNGRTLVNGTGYKLEFERFKEVLNLRTLIFNYDHTENVYYAGNFYMSLPDNIFSANALKVGDNIFPMSTEVASDNLTQKITMKNYSGSENPISDGQYKVVCSIEPIGMHRIDVYSFTNTSLEFSLVIINDN